MEIFYIPAIQKQRSFKRRLYDRYTLVIPSNIILICIVRISNYTFLIIQNDKNFSLGDLSRSIIKAKSSIPTISKDNATSFYRVSILIR